MAAEKTLKKMKTVFDIKWKSNNMSLKSLGVSQSWVSAWIRVLSWVNGGVWVKSRVHECESELSLKSLGLGLGWVFSLWVPVQVLNNIINHRLIVYKYSGYKAVKKYVASKTHSNVVFIGKR